MGVHLAVHISTLLEDARKMGHDEDIFRMLRDRRDIENIWHAAGKLSGYFERDYEVNSRLESHKLMSEEKPISPMQF